MNFGDLIASVSQDLWPEGESENLVLSHRKYFIQALTDLQNNVPCLRYANTAFFPQCSTYFNCGMTVLPQPPGQVLRVYTIGKQFNNGQTQGTQVGTVTVVAPFTVLNNGVITAPVTAGLVTSVPIDGIYTVEVNVANALKALYPANSPQYLTVAINYTDTTGKAQTVNPAPITHVSDAGQAGTLAIDVKGGTDITYTITPFNQPQTDNEMTVVVNVVNGVVGASNDDWCAKVYFEQVEYMYIERYVAACAGCSSNKFWSMCNAILFNIFGHWRTKRLYNPPTDIGFEGLPPLPPGFHYPQTSTDAGGRSPRGFYAIKHERIYLAPWIESTESVVVEWNGLKTNWISADLVSDDPKFIEAVRLLVGIQHYMHYEHNQERLNDFRLKLYGGRDSKGNQAIGVMRELIVACRDKIRVRTAMEVGSNEGDAAGGIGITTGASNSTAIFYSTAQSSGGVTTPAGAYSSTLSQADADAKALAAAQAAAQAQNTPPVPPPTAFLNTQQSYTASCPGASGGTPAATGSSVTITVPAGQFQSAISQALADAAALSAAQATAESQLVCTYFNAAQTADVTCVDTTHESVTVPAGQFTSTKSQADADQQALSSAQSQATSECSTPPGAFTIGNTQQSVPYNFVITVSCGSFPVAGVVIVPANTFYGQTNAANQAIVQANLNAQAQAAGQAQIAALRQAFTVHYQALCFSGKFGP